MNVFDSKEQYLNFRKAWKTAVKSELNKPRMITIERKPWWEPSIESLILKAPGEEWVSPAHHVLFNILRGVPADIGFTKITNNSELGNGNFPNSSFIRALYSLNFYVDHAKYYLKYSTDRYLLENEFVQKRVPEHKNICDNFLKVFNGTVSIEILCKIKFLEYFSFQKNSDKTLVWFVK